MVQGERRMIRHVALWVRDLKRSKDFYVRWFGAKAGADYHNPKKGFSSCFLTWDQGGALELMHSLGGSEEGDNRPAGSPGWAHLALGVLSEDRVRTLTEELRAAGVKIVSDPRRTGDGYYESVIEDPEGNLVEITV